METVRPPLPPPEDDTGHYPERLERLERAKQPKCTTMELISQIDLRSTGTHQEIL